MRFSALEDRKSFCCSLGHSQNTKRVSEFACVGKLLKELQFRNTKSVNELGKEGRLVRAEHLPIQGSVSRLGIGGNDNEDGKSF